MARRHRHRRGTRPLRHANHLETRAHPPRPSSDGRGFFMPACMADATRHRQPNDPAIFFAGPFHFLAPKCPNPPPFPRRTIGMRHRPIPQGHGRKERGVNAIILHGIPQPCRAKSLPIHEMDMGVASDVIGYPITRPAVRTDLPGRPRPHGRASSPDRFAASRTTRPHTFTGGAE